MRSNRTIRRSAALVAVVLAAIAMSACTKAPTTPARAPEKPAASAAFPVKLTDDAGRVVSIDSVPKRVVCLAPANTEIVYALGALDRVVGVTTYDDYPAQVKDIAKMGDFQTPNLEAIAAAKPDLVLVTGGVQADVLSKLEGLGAKILVIDPKNLAGVFASISTVSKALGAEARGTQVTDSMKAKLTDIKTRIGSEAPVTCFVEIGWNPLFTAGRGTLMDDLITHAGGKNVVTQQGYVGYSTEQLLRDQPRVYLGAKSSMGDPFAIDQRPGYQRLVAVISGRVIVLDDNIVSRPGPRVVEGVLAIARVLHPDKL
jgi:iron complex transport system substrate-binding protein